VALHRLGVSVEATREEEFGGEFRLSSIRLQLATVREGGNAVMNVSCVKGLDQSRSACFEAFECHGTAVTLNRPGIE
jgi:hypothetical protein